MVIVPCRPLFSSWWLMVLLPQFHMCHIKTLENGKKKGRNAAKVIIFCLS